MSKGKTSKGKISKELYWSGKWSKIVWLNDGRLDTLLIVWDELNIVTKIMYKLRHKEKEKKVIFFV